MSNSFKSHRQEWLEYGLSVKTILVPAAKSKNLVGLPLVALRAF